MDPTQLTATEAARLIAARRISAEDLVVACLARIEQRERTVRAWAYIDKQHALRQARRLDKLGRPLGPLHGVPVGVKDIIDTRDMPTEYNSPIYRGHRPARDAEVVTRLGDDAVCDSATVYRNLVALVGVHLVRVASHAGGICRYEIARAKDECAHPHFLCDDCGIVSCLPETEVVTPKKAKWMKSLRAAEVQFVGRCPTCAEG